MSFATLNSKPVVAAVISMPRVGAWTAEVVADAQEEISGEVSLAAGGLTWRGASLRSGVARDSVRAELVGGRGKLGAEIAPKFYRSATVRLVVEDLLGAAGERLSATADDSLLARQLASWSRVGGKAGAALRQICDAYGASWRALADGTIWVGLETWPEAQLEHELIAEDPKAGWVEISSEDLSLRPGTMFRGRRIERVEHRISARSLRSRAWFADVQSEDLAASVAALVRHHTAGSVYLGQFPARVVSQNADGTLELKPDDSRLPGMSQVPIRYGIPGVSAEVLPGARVAVEFEAGDPARPVATVWESGTVTKLLVTASVEVTVEAPVVNVGNATQKVNLAGGGAGIARMGDTVQAGPFAGAVTKGSVLATAGG